ncbi:MAG: phosphoserine phosphatase SerB [Pseudomonadota bacterium]
MSTPTLVLCAAHGQLTRDVLDRLPLKKSSLTWIEPETAAYTAIPATDEDALKSALTAAPLDWHILPGAPKSKRLFLADMDSTMIEIECIDELADYAGVKAEVSAVTERAMRGELDFREALNARVQLLEGLSESVLQDCYEERVRFSEGAKAAVTTMAENGCRCVLVSGGFTFFTSRVAEALGFDRHRANVLEVKDGRLTGKVLPPISDASTKLETLTEESHALALAREDILAVGDGANDIPMLQAAGLGVAYRAKPKTAAAAHCALDHADLRGLLYLQGLTLTP